METEYFKATNKLNIHYKDLTFFTLEGIKNFWRISSIDYRQIVNNGKRVEITDQNFTNS